MIHLRTVLVFAAALAGVCALHAQSAAQGLEAFEDELTAIAETATPYCVKVVVTRQLTTISRRAGDETNIVRKFESDVSLSGLLLDAEGHVVTLGETLKNPIRVSASLFDGEEEKVFKASVVGFEPKCNLGVIRLESEEAFDAPVLADSDRLKPVSLAVGLGFPFDLGPGPSVSIGHVCARKRQFTAGAARYDDLIEVSFPIRPGETGGVLLDSAGEVSGLLLTSYNGSRPQFPASGISLAIPINELKVEARKIIDMRTLASAAPEKKPTPWLGFVAGEVDDPILREKVELQKGGVIILQVHVDQPAAKAGIEKDDILVRWNGQNVVSLEHLRELFKGTGVGESVNVILLRKGKQIEKQLVVGGN